MILPNGDRVPCWHHAAWSWIETILSLRNREVLDQSMPLPESMAYVKQALDAYRKERETNDSTS